MPRIASSQLAVSGIAATGAAVYTLAANANGDPNEYFSGELFDSIAGFPIQITLLSGTFYLRKNAPDATGTLDFDVSKVDPFGALTYLFQGSILPTDGDSFLGPLSLMVPTSELVIPPFWGLRFRIHGPMKETQLHHAEGLTLTLYYTAG